MNRILRKINRYLPAFSMVMIPVALIALAVNIGYILSPAFADFFNLFISQHVRAFTASVSGIFAFSLAEFIVLASPVIAVCIIVIATRKASRGSRYFVRVIAGLISILLFLYSLFVFSFGAGYRTTAIDKKLGIPRAEVTAEELADGAKALDDAGCHVDYIITHEPPSLVKSAMLLRQGDIDHVSKLNGYFEEIGRSCTFKHWFFGSLHEDRQLTSRYTCVFKKVIPIDYSERRAGHAK